MTLEQLLGFSGIKQTALIPRKRGIFIGVGYAWGVDARVPCACLSPRASEPQPGYLFDSSSVTSSVPSSRGRQSKVARSHRHRVAEILQRIVDSSQPRKTKSATEVGDDESVGERGESLKRFPEPKLRRLTAEPPSQLLESIVAKIVLCDILIFDLTDYGKFHRGEISETSPNSNVLLEIGIAMGMNLVRYRHRLPQIPVLLVQLDHEGCRTPSDLHGLCVHRYRLRDQPSSRASAGQSFVVEFPYALQTTLREAVRIANECVKVRAR